MLRGGRCAPTTLQANEGDRLKRAIKYAIREESKERNRRLYILHRTREPRGIPSNNYALRKAGASDLMHTIFPSLARPHIPDVITRISAIGKICRMASFIVILLTTFQLAPAIPALSFQEACGCEDFVSMARETTTASPTLHHIFSHHLESDV